MPDLAGAVDRGDRRRGIEGLADFPGAAHLAHLHLQVAAGHVEADGIAPDVFECLFDRDIRTSLADHGHQLGLVVVVLRLRRIRQVQRGTCLHRDDRVRRLAEEERRLAVGIEAHLARMGGVVAAHAIDAAHGELVVAAGNGDGNGGGGREDVGHGSRFPEVVR
ncbi:hypothetical protein D3C72_1427010 [compost metagenome]